MPSSVDLPELLSQVNLAPEDLIQASGACIEEIGRWTQGVEIPQEQQHKLAQLGALISCLVQIMPPQAVQSWLHQEVHGLQGLNALQAIQAEHGDYVLDQINLISRENPES